MDGTRIPVNEAVALPTPILTHPANTPFPRGNTTLPGAQFTLDLSSAQGGEIGGELCLDEALRGHLSPCVLRKTEKRWKGESTKTRPAKLQELPFRQLELRMRKPFAHGTNSLRKNGLIVPFFIPKDMREGKVESVRGSCRRLGLCLGHLPKDLCLGIQKSISARRPYAPEASCFPNS